MNPFTERAKLLTNFGALTLELERVREEIAFYDRLIAVMPAPKASQEAKSEDADKAPEDA